MQNKVGEPAATLKELHLLPEWGQNFFSPHSWRSFDHNKVLAMLMNDHDRARSMVQHFAADTANQHAL